MDDLIAVGFGHICFYAALMWAWGMFLVLPACIREQMVGPYKTSNPAAIIAVYGGYMVVPVLIMIRVAFTPVFHTGKQKLT